MIRLSPEQHEKEAKKAAEEGRWDDMLHHAGRVPTNWDFHQQIPSLWGDQGMPEEAIKAVINHLPKNHPNFDSFLFELSSNLPHSFKDKELLPRLAELTAGRDYLASDNFMSHPEYDPLQSHRRLHHVGEFWKQYEMSVHPDHFAAVKSYHTGKPEKFKDYRGGHDGDSNNYNQVLPHFREYAKAVQDKILKDDSIPKRYAKDNKPYIKVYRGLGGHYGKALHEAAKYDPETNTAHKKSLVIPKSPFSSWTTDKEQADRFASYRSEMENHPVGKGTVISKWMPVEDILHSGFHQAYPHQSHAHPAESEIIFQHPKGKMKISTKDLSFQRQPEERVMSKPSLIEPEDKLKPQSIKLEKGIKDKLVSLATAATMLGISVPAHTPDTPYIPKTDQHVIPHKDLKPIEMIESTGGKHLNHKLVNYGLNKGSKALGRYGFMPIQVQDTISHDSQLSNKYGHLLKLDPIKDQIKIAKVLKHPEVQHEIANSHWRRLSKHFHSNLPRMAYAWKNGISAASEASDDEINHHPYVQKYLKLRKMLNLENKPKKLHKTQDIKEKVRHIKKFIPSKEKYNQLGLKITALIEAGAVRDLSNEGHFTHSSFVVGLEHENSWLLKLESENRPGIQSAQYGLQSVKEAAFYDAAKYVFNLDKFIPEAVLGETEKKLNNADTFEFIPTAAIKMVPQDHELAAKLEDERPGSVKTILENHRKNGDLQRLSIMFIVLGESDSHGQNLMISPKTGDMQCIDHGTSFSDATFNPHNDAKIFIPYFLRVGRVKHRMSDDEKLANLASIDNPEVDLQVKSWVISLNDDKLTEILKSYDIDPAPSLSRLNMIRTQLNSGTISDITNRFWVYGPKENQENPQVSQQS